MSLHLFPGAMLSRQVGACGLADAAPAVEFKFNEALQKDFKRSEGTQIWTTKVPGGGVLPPSRWNAS